MEPGHDVSRSDLRNRSIGFDAVPVGAELHQGAQDRLVPARKGCIPEAPTGGQSAHAGTLLDGAVTALPEDPPEPAREDAAEPVVPDVPDRLPVAPPEAPIADEALPAEPVVEPPVVVLAFA